MVKIHNICDYYPTRISGAPNPAFQKSRESKLLLDLKDPNHSNHKNSVAYFAGKLNTFLNKSEFDTKNCVAAVIPSSKANLYSAGLVSILELLKEKHGFEILPTLLIRTKEIASLHSGGMRHPSVHYYSISVQKQLLESGKNILLLDDITTSGGSFEACEQILIEAGFKAKLFTVAIGRTSYAQ